MSRLLVLLALASSLLAMVAASSAPRVWSTNEFLPMVNLGNGPGVHMVKRQAIQNPQPIRVAPFYQSSVDQNLISAKSSMIRNEIIPGLLSFLEQTLSVERTPGNILINTNCSDRLIIPLGDGEFVCANECETTTLCGNVPVPAAHLKECRECNGASVSNPRTQCAVGSPAGAGVDTDFILYVSAEQSKCPASSGSGPQTVAVALACQMESTLDRPVAGVINFCPDGLANSDQVSAFSLVKHEMLHALGFASSLFPFWRRRNGTPRTDRDGDGFPPQQNGMFVAGDTTITTVTYNDWVTNSNQADDNTVTVMVTPRVLNEARDHFGCPSLSGVELENQGGPGTAISHWEKRILGNEAMTGVLSFNPVFSRITYAALEDSGWYNVNYATAEPLAWGKGAGCRFAMGSCREWINRQRQTFGAQASTSPFCDTLSTEQRLDCTADRNAVGQCDLATLPITIPDQFQYFSNAAQGGSNQIADFCPVNQFVTFLRNGQSVGTNCSDVSNQPSDSSNLRLENYNAGSRCLNHGRQWTVNGNAVSTYGGGCYQYQCSVDGGVRVAIGSNVYQCTCEGEEITIGVRENGFDYVGSFICPSCSQICYDDLSSCPASEQPACYDRVTAGVDALLEGATLPPPATMASGPGGSSSQPGPGGSGSRLSVSLWAISAGVLLAIASCYYH